jgi:hypothetical protein
VRPQARGPPDLGRRSWKFPEVSGGFRFSSGRFRFACLGLDRKDARLGLGHNRVGEVRRIPTRAAKPVLSVSLRATPACRSVRAGCANARVPWSTAAARRGARLQAEAWLITSDARAMAWSSYSSSNSASKRNRICRPPALFQCAWRGKSWGVRGWVGPARRGGEGQVMVHQFAVLVERLDADGAEWVGFHRFLLA